MKDKIERLERQLLAIQSELDVLKNPAPEPEIDWEAMVGRLVEVRDESEDWKGPVLLSEHNPHSPTMTFKTGIASWKHARLYTGPTSINWIKHDGRSIPAEDDVKVMFKDDSGYEGCDFAGSLSWSHITHYSVIESKPQ